MEVRREVDVQASPEEVWEALVTEEGRAHWLEEPDREIHVEAAQAPHRLVWWWGGQDEPATRVSFEILPLPAGSRVVVTETAPVRPVPLASLAASFAPVCA